MMHRFIALFTIMGALVLTAMPGSVWAQSGNIGGTIGKKDKVITGGDQPAKRPAYKTRAPAAAQRGDACRGLVGTWTWYLGIDAVFNADQSVGHAINTGKWTCTARSLVIVWTNIGITDRGIFSDNGATLSIVNSRGERFIATRK